MLGGLDLRRGARGLLVDLASLSDLLQVAAPEVFWSLAWTPLVWLLFRSIYRRVGGTKLA